MLDLKKLKETAKLYGYYADSLRVFELIEEVTRLREENAALKGNSLNKERATPTYFDYLGEYDDYTGGD